LAESAQWQHRLRSLEGTDWVVYAKPPFGGPAQVLEYLARYTHRVACLPAGRPSATSAWWPSPPTR